MAIYLSAHITSIYASTILRDFLKPIEALRQPSPHASYTQISKVGLPRTSSQPLHYRLRRAKQNKKFCTVWDCYYPNFVPKIFSYFFQKANIVKIMVNVQKRLNGTSSQAEFWHGENIDHAKKKCLSWWNWTSKKTNIVFLFFSPILLKGFKQNSMN